MTRKQINLNDDGAYKALQHLAARLGYLTVGSAAHGEGSIRQMLLAVARGELSIVKHTDSHTPDVDRGDTGGDTQRTKGIRTR